MVSPQTAATILSRTEWVYDDVGRVREEKRSSDMAGIPYAVTATLYTPTDQPYSVTDPLGRTTTTEYDPLDRAIRVTAPWEGTAKRVSEIVYDIAGRKRIERSAVGTDVQQDSATYAYYDDDQVRTITDPRSNILTHAYDGFGRLSMLSYPDGAVESYGGACPGPDPGTPTTTARVLPNAMGRSARPPMTC